MRSADVVSVGEVAATAAGCGGGDRAASAAGREITGLDSSRSGVSVMNDSAANASGVNGSPRSYRNCLSSARSGCFHSLEKSMIL